MDHLLERIATVSAAVAASTAMGAIYLRHNPLIFTPAKEHDLGSTIDRRRRAAAERTIGRGNMVDAYLDMSTQHTSDEENSHDITINAAKKRNYFSSTC